MSSYEDQSKQLPSWFVAPTPRHTEQAELFMRPLGEVVAEINVSIDEATRWQTNGWISFAVDAETKVGHRETGELVLVRDVVRSGLPDALVQHRLSRLPRPYHYDPHVLVFSYCYGWVEVDFKPKQEEAAQIWIDCLQQEERLDELVELRDRLEEVIEQLEDSSIEDEED